MIISVFINSFLKTFCNFCSVKVIILHNIFYLCVFKRNMFAWKLSH